MKILFISRKNPHSVGGLARFVWSLSSQFPNSYLLSPTLASILNLKSSIQNLDLVHLCDGMLLPLGIILKFLWNKPLTVTIHGAELTSRNPLLFLYRHLLFYPDAIILDSKAAAGLFARNQIPVTRYQIISPGISVNQFSQPQTVSLPQTKGKTVLLTVGHHIRRKGQNWFRAKVLPLLSKNYLYLTPPTNLSTKQLAYLFRKADIYLAPNQKIPGDFEGFGLAAGEAAALGLPVIASGVDGLPSVIHHKKNGLLVEPRPEAFLNALKLLQNPKTRLALGKKAKIYTRKNFTWQKTAEEYLKMWQLLLYKKPRSPAPSAPR